MKIVYILKKGFQCYPPCLAQLLYLNDLGVELEVYHGENSEAVNNILQERGIKHYTLQSDRKNTNRIGSIVTMLKYMREISKIIKKVDNDTLLWFGNCESFITITKLLKNRKYVLSVLELDDYDSLYGKNIRKVIHSAKAVLCCEKHRAAIMKVYYGLDKEPYVLPNKPYELKNEEAERCVLPLETQEKIERLQDKFIVLYQGIITPDRPLDKIAKALSNIGDENIVFTIMGQASEEYKKELSLYYNHIEFMGYIPSPQHLEVTKIANVGIANYDYSCLNNLFCAPNKIYEYAKFGLPMLTSQNIGLTETVGRFGAAECVDFNDVKQIEIGIKKIKDNYNSYVNNAYKFYNHTDNFETIKTIIEGIAE